MLSLSLLSLPEYEYYINFRHLFHLLFILTSSFKIAHNYLHLNNMSHSVPNSKKTPE